MRHLLRAKQLKNGPNVRPERLRDTNQLPQTLWAGFKIIYLIAWAFPPTRLMFIDVNIGTN